MLQRLLEDDSHEHLPFRKIVLNEQRLHNDIIDKIMWSDEAHFKLSGIINGRTLFTIQEKYSSCNH